MSKTQAFDKKNIVVTGGAGFIGSHLCDLLVQRHKVICIDNFSTGREENIHHLLSHPDFEFIRHDLTEPLDLTTLKELRAFQVPFQGVQEVYHLASPSAPKDYTRLSVETLLANAIGTQRALELTKQFNAKFLLVSSGSIYGEPTDPTPLPENYFGYVNPIGVRSPYQEGKRFAEALTVAYRERYKLEAKIVRLFNTYGPRMGPNDGRLISQLINLATGNQPLIIHGQKEDLTSYIYITDALEALTRMMASTELGPLNIGNPQTHTLYDVAQQIVILTGVRPDIRYEPATPVDSRQPIPVVRQARELLGWFPIVPLEEGLKRTIDYMLGLRRVGIESLSFNQTP